MNLLVLNYKLSFLYCKRFGGLGVIEYKLLLFIVYIIDNEKSF